MQPPSLGQLAKCQDAIRVRQARRSDTQKAESRKRERPREMSEWEDRKDTVIIAVRDENVNEIKGEMM